MRIGQNYRLLHSFSNVDYIETWQIMERLVSTGKVKSIGVSNFNSEQIARLLSVARIVPVVNQVECSPQINQKKLTKFCRERNIVVTGFCPLGHPNPAARTPDFMYDARVRAIADKYGKSAAQIGLKYLVRVEDETTLCCLNDNFFFYFADRTWSRADPEDCTQKPDD